MEKNKKLTVSSSAAMTKTSHPQLLVDLAENTGALKYGATGFLYGLGVDGTPTDNMLIPLKPQVTAQKAPDGLQHPTGDALQIAPQYFRAGGREIQIYMQDIYAEWPYENKGIDDYISKVETQVKKVVADPYRTRYVYVPFNEPDFIWYNTSDRFQAFLQDWKAVYQKIRSLDPTAKIAGPNWAIYHPDAMDAFMVFAKEYDVLPDVTTWHELQDNFFANWTNNYHHYREIESNLGISPCPISINEYGRSSGDLAVPGHLLQFMARFEKAKVDACLAFWTSPGSLNDLVVENNKPTGAWWLYKWYGEMTGYTVGMIPPDENAFGLQGVASLDSGKKQVRVICGGISGRANIVVHGFHSAVSFGDTVHVTVWGVDSVGVTHSGGPYLKQEGDYTVKNGQITVHMDHMKTESAYLMIITPATALTPADNRYRYEAEYANISGSATIADGFNSNGYSGTSFVEGYSGSNHASTQFVVNAEDNGYHHVTLRYAAGPLRNAPINRTIRVMLNGKHLTDLVLPGTPDWNQWNSVTIKPFLTAGINRIDFNAFTNDDSNAIHLDYIDVIPTTGTIGRYEAEAPGNTLSGTAVRTEDAAASGGQMVGWIGGGAENYLQFNDIVVPASGLYRMVVTYANGETSGSHDYNSRPVEREAAISVNGNQPFRSVFRNTFGWSNYHTTVIDVTLNSGSNTIRFFNTTGFAPNIDKIEIATAIG
ncbi:dockerin [Desmospora activa]|uniref:CBM6 domain-containing protein n=1 Tax=Desmospora activa DSM 45169 TaxID=1121389 RepID=A0A2T4ZBZ3_9BACL|nr:dockerin [Desmospora activa]PTM59413.1 hypothetical protein C8J48_2032 [Desmospora activa DSM 45169]